MPFSYPKMTLIAADGNSSVMLERRADGGIDMQVDGVVSVNGRNEDESLWFTVTPDMVKDFCVFFTGKPTENIG